MLLLFLDAVDDVGVVNDVIVVVVNVEVNGIILPSGERASVRVRTTLDRLDAFLHLQQPGIEIHLCFGAQSLGKASLPIHSLLAESPSKIFMQVPNAFEGVTTTFRHHLSDPHFLNRHSFHKVRHEPQPIFGFLACFCQRDLSPQPDF